MAGAREDDPVAAVELSPEQVFPKLPGLGGAEVPGLEPGPQFGEVGNPVRIKALVETYLQCGRYATAME